MTVSEMIARLTRMVAADPSVGDLEVITEGCDCEGDSAQVRVESCDGRHGYRRVLIARDEKSPGTLGYWEIEAL